MIKNPMDTNYVPPLDGNRAALQTSSTQLPKQLRRNSKRRVISVFGSATARPGGKLFADSYKMGRLLGAAGFDVMTGGYQGVMEAASRGAHAAGAQVVGVTMDRFADKVNPYVMSEIRTASFYERFAWLVDRADGYIAMPGGIGTLVEITFTWQELLLGNVVSRPLIVIGERWRRAFECFRANLIAPRKIYQAVKIVATPEDALKRLRQHFSKIAELPHRA
jgi:uncharacterized protein (TIGR00730 family)